MSNPDLRDLQRDYKFRLEQARRCESCRHVMPTPGSFQTFEGECRLLDIHIANVSKSNCPGWQTNWKTPPVRVDGHGVGKGGHAGE